MICWYIYHILNTSNNVTRATSANGVSMTNLMTLSNEFTSPSSMMMVPFSTSKNGFSLLNTYIDIYTMSAWDLKMVSGIGTWSWVAVGWKLNYILEIVWDWWAPRSELMRRCSKRPTTRFQHWNIAWNHLWIIEHARRTWTQLWKDPQLHHNVLFYCTYVTL